VHPAGGRAVVAVGAGGATVPVAAAGTEVVVTPDGPVPTARVVEVDATDRASGAPSSPEPQAASATSAAITTAAGPRAVRDRRGVVPSVDTVMRRILGSDPERSRRGS
jgi:hypothetical protein